MRIDVNAFVGRYPFRDVGATPDELASTLQGAHVTEAWVSHLDGIFWRDPAASNAWLVECCRDRLGWRPVGAVHPSMPDWESTLDALVIAGSPSVRCDPTRYGIAPDGADMRMLGGACAERGVALQLSVRLEDARQRHPHDIAADIAPWVIRSLVRCHPRLRLVVTHADRDCVEQVHFGSTPAEAGRILWDISWIWGPPEDHLALLIETVGIDRFAFGSGAPLRLIETSVAKVELLQLDAARQQRLDADNAGQFSGTDR